MLEWGPKYVLKFVEMKGSVASGKWRKVAAMLKDLARGGILPRGTGVVREVGGRKLVEGRCVQDGTQASQANGAIGAGEMGSGK